MQHFLNGENIGLITARSNKSETCDHFYISKNIMETKCGERTIQSAIFPLYLYPEITAQQTLDGKTERTPNLNPEIVKQIEEGLGIAFVSEKTTLSGFGTLKGLDDTDKELPKTFAPIDILDYIYAVLHSPSYREKYKEFLKIDFPRVPYPKSTRQFIDLVDLGSQLRQIHLLESPVVEDYITQYPEDGDNIVTKPKYEQRNFVMDENTITHNDTIEPMGRVYINETQYFENVPEVAWNFYIGGYQPAQKWLKDRKERELSYEDILHYQKIIVALSETDRIMKEIDTIEI
jgi:predicted helicase